MIKFLDKSTADEADGRAPGVGFDKRGKPDLPDKNLPMLYRLNQFRPAVRDLYIDGEALRLEKARLPAEKKRQPLDPDRRRTPDDRFFFFMIHTCSLCMETVFIKKPAHGIVDLINDPLVAGFFADQIQLNCLKAASITSQKMCFFISSAKWLIWRFMISFDASTSPLTQQFPLITLSIIFCHIWNKMFLLSQHIVII